MAALIYTSPLKTCLGIVCVLLSVVFFVLQPNPGLDLGLNPGILFDENSSPILSIHIQGWGVVMLVIVICVKKKLL